MIERLRQVRLSRSQVGLVALVSAIATVVIVLDGTPGQTAVQAEVLADLQHRGLVVHRLDAAATGPAAQEGAASGGSAGPGPVLAGGSEPRTSPSGGNSGG
ncbi:MAG: hypothetical protein JO244_11630, partial [Solirubrobacterales bacterium]|nr:hypothetical protein [Solirubrobacterales bacterium]